MMDVRVLFRQRLKTFLLELIRYGQYVANGGVLVVVMVLVGLLSFYYRSLIGQIPESFPIPYVVAFVVAVFVTKSPHRTFLQEADLIFLTPMETRMGGYFQKAQLYNMIVQSIGLFLLLLLLLPLYYASLAQQEDTIQLAFYWAVPFLLKGWNVYSSWIYLRLPEQSRVSLYTLARFLYSFIVLAWVYSEGRLFVYEEWQYGGVVCILPVIWFHVRVQAIRKKHGYNWYRLLAMETRLRGRFYRIVNNFKDVPALQHQIKPRDWLTPVARIIPYRKQNAERFLFLRMFLRTGDFAGVYARLVLLGAVLILLLPNGYVKATVAMLFLFMSGTQLNGLWSRQRKRNDASILPFDEKQQKRSFTWVRRALLAVQLAVFALAGFW